jgi:hypothetical protein
MEAMRPRQERRGTAASDAMSKADWRRLEGILASRPDTSQDSLLVGAAAGLRSKIEDAYRKGGKTAVLSAIRSKAVIAPVQEWFVSRLSEAAALRGGEMTRLPGEEYSRAGRVGRLPQEPFVVTEKMLRGGTLDELNIDVVAFGRGRPAMATTVKSQMSSFGKNFSNHIKNITGEMCITRQADPRLVWGVVYVLPTVSPMAVLAGDDEQGPNMEGCLKTLLALGDRSTPVRKACNADRVCALVVDFHWDQAGVAPEVVDTVGGLLSRGLVSPKFAVGLPFEKLAPAGLADALVSASLKRGG